MVQSSSHLIGESIVQLFIYSFPHSSVNKSSACNVGDLGSIPGLGSSPGAGNGNLLQYSCLENPTDIRNLAGYSSWDCKSQTRLSSVFLSIYYLTWDFSQDSNGQGDKRTYLWVKYQLRFTFPIPPGVNRNIRMWGI